MRGTTWVSAQGFIGALDFFLSRPMSSQVGEVLVESKSVFPSDHYRVQIRLLTIPALAAPGIQPPQLVSSWGPVSANGSGTLLQTIERSTFHAPGRCDRDMPPFCGCHDHGGRSGFGAPSTPDTVPGLVTFAANVLHALVKAHL